MKKAFCNCRLLLCLVALALLGIDIYFKAYIHRTIPMMYASQMSYPYGGIAIFHDVGGISFSINHVINHGAAWGLFASFSKMLLFFRIFVVCGIIGYLILRPASKQFAPLVLVVTGAIGNVIDEFIYGHVIDMFHFKFWNYTYPIFNIADSVIFCGVIWLLFLSFRDSKIRETA